MSGDHVRYFNPKSVVNVIQNGVDSIALIKIISFQGLKCSFDLCRICCRIKAIDEDVDCPGNY